MSEQNIANQHDFGFVEVTIECSAKFNQLMSGNPATKIYKKWALNLFNTIRESFDWSLCQEKLKDATREEAFFTIIDDKKNQTTKSLAEPTAENPHLTK